MTRIPATTTSVGEFPAGAANAVPGFFAVRDALEHVEAMTRKIFAGDIQRMEREDSEVVGDRHFTFRVKDTGSADEILARYNQWHAQLTNVPADLRAMFRLSVDAQ